MQPDSANSGSKKMMVRLSSWYIGCMRLDQLFYLSSESHWVTLFGEAGPQSASWNELKTKLPIVAGRLLDCRDPDQLEMFLDESLDDPEASKSYKQLNETLHSMGGSDPLPNDVDPRPEIARFLGEGAAGLISRAWTDLVEQSKTYASMTKLLGEEQMLVMMATEPDGTLGRNILDDSLPVELRKLMFEWTTGSLCGFAMAAAIVQKRRVPDWLGVCLVERFLEGGRSFVRFLQHFSVPLVVQVKPALSTGTRHFERHPVHTNYLIRSRIGLNQW